VVVDVSDTECEIRFTGRGRVNLERPVADRVLHIVGREGICDEPYGVISTITGGAVRKSL
jgi:hypothetical protein